MVPLRLSLYLCGLHFELTRGIHTHMWLCASSGSRKLHGAKGSERLCVFMHRQKEGVRTGYRLAPVGEREQTWERNIKLDLISTSSLANRTDVLGP